MIDWSSIIIAVITGIGGFSLSAFLFPRKEARKAEADTRQRENEADRAQAEADSTRVEAMGRFIDEIQEQTESYLGLIREKDATIADLSERLLQESNARTRAEMDLCVHRGCSIRRPDRGQGSKWQEEHLSDPSNGADYDPVEVLLQKYRKKTGNEIKVIKKETVSKNNGND